MPCTTRPRLPLRQATPATTIPIRAIPMHSGSRTTSEGGTSSSLPQPACHHDREIPPPPRWAVGGSPQRPYGGSVPADPDPDLGPTQPGPTQPGPTQPGQAVHERTLTGSPFPDDDGAAQPGVR